MKRLISILSLALLCAALASCGTGHQRKFDWLHAYGEKHYYWPF